MFQKKINQLEPPPIAKMGGAQELLRVWSVPDGPQQLTIETTWDDPAGWGLLLADIARHAAKAYAASAPMSESEALKRIRLGLDAEWGNPADNPVQVDD